MQKITLKMKQKTLLHSLHRVSFAVLAVVCCSAVLSAMAHASVKPLSAQPTPEQRRANVERAAQKEANLAVRKGKVDQRQAKRAAKRANKAAKDAAARAGQGR